MNEPRKKIPAWAWWVGATIFVLWAANTASSIKNHQTAQVQPVVQQPKKAIEVAKVVKPQQVSPAPMKKPKTEAQSLEDSCPYFAEMGGSDLYFRVQDKISARLKTPSTAKFPSYSKIATVSAWNDGQKACMVKLVGYVDSQNSFGALLRSQFSALFKFTEQPERSAKLVEVRVWQ